MGAPQAPGRTIRNVGRRPARINPEVLAERLAKRSIFLCLDYDGTLVPIAPRPDQATFDDSGRRLLRRLSRWIPIAIVSGRRRATLRQLVGVPSLYYVGNHGSEISGPGVRFRASLPATWPRELDRLLTTIESDAPRGVLVERKGPTASVHYRLVDPTERRRWLPALRASLVRATAAGHIRLVQGHAVLDLRPPGDWHKGTAVRWLIGRPRLSASIAVYLGDDATDEDAFRAIRYDGIGVLVGRPRRTAARYYLPDTDHVRRFIVSCLSVMTTAKGRPRG